MSKLSLSKNKAKKKMSEQIAGGSQKTLTSFFTRTVTISEDEEKKEVQIDEVEALFDSKENGLKRDVSNLKPSVEKLALLEKPVPQIVDVEDLTSPTKKKSKPNSQEDAGDITEASCGKPAVATKSVLPEAAEEAQFVGACGDSSILEVSDFGSWSDYDCDFEDEIKKSEENKLDLSKIQRCLVETVQNNDDGSKSIEVSLFSNSIQKTWCTLKGSWAWESNLCRGSIVNIRALRGENGWEVSHDPDDASLLVEEPDRLLSCTTVMSALRCRRAAVLSEMFRGLGRDDSGGYLALGKLMHEVTQRSLEQRLQGQDAVAALFESLLQSSSVIYELFVMRNDLQKLKEAAQPYYPAIARFLELYASDGPHFNKELLSEASKQGSDAWPGKIDEIVDIEDTLWIPQLGLKGKLDLTSKVKRVDSPQNIKLAPLELKTGRMDTDQVAHRGQLMLYSSMLTEIEQTPVDFGLLIYLKNCAVKEVRANKGEMRDVMILRNELAKFIGNAPTVEVKEEQNGAKILNPPALPEPIKRPRECAKCPYLEVCSAYSTKEEHNSPVQRDRLQERQHNLTQDHINYFLHWSNLSQIEEKEVTVALSLLWTKTPQEREKKKLSCLGDLKIVSVEKDGAQFKTVLVRSEDSILGTNLDTAGFGIGDFIIFGNQRRLVLGLGTITSISTDSVAVVLDKDCLALYGEQSYSIDIYKSNRMLTTKLVALGSLLNDSEEAFKLRRLIIDKIEPKFESNKTMSYVEKMMPDVIASLNEEQKQCIQKVLEAKDYVLVRGLPGSGKTATIVILVRILVALGYSVLVTSHTNSAVDNVLSKLVPFDLNILRLGASNKFASTLKNFTEQAMMATATSIDHLEQLLLQKTVVGVTCTSANHALLRRKRFDFCIVDEATQVPQPAAISALLCAKAFVLVGDPDQLQPVVGNKVALELGMQETLFDRLNRPESTAVLGLQYRMNASICSLANKVTYNGALRCGNEKVAQSKFELPNKKVLEGAPTWAKSVLGEENSVVFLDTGCTRVQGEIVEDEVSNEKEANILAQLIQLLLEAGINKNDIGVMSPFRRQVGLILSKLPSDSPVEVSTVDQFQGKDKLVCLVSFVKSFENSEETPKREGILNDAKRLTVAITRARVKLIMVGDLGSLQCYEPIQRLKTALGDCITKLEI